MEGEGREEKGVDGEKVSVEEGERRRNRGWGSLVVSTGLHGIRADTWS